MKGWILFHRDLDPALPEVPEIFRFQEAAADAGMRLDVVKPECFDLVVGAGGDWNMHYGGDRIPRPDFVLCRTGAETDYATLALLRKLERRGVRMVNGSATIELVADKLHTLQTLSRAGLPIPRTILGKFPIDTDMVQRELGFPVIVKTLKGTRGAGVLKCEDRSQFEDLTGLLDSAGAQADFILQHYIRASHGRDVRVLVVGGRVIAAMERRSLTGGFKSNVSLGGVGIAYNPPSEMAELAVAAAEALDLDVTGIDILFDETGYRICEANSAPGFQGLERACGVDVPAAILQWVATTQGRTADTRAPDEGGATLDLLFSGRTGLRALSDRSPGYRSFAGKAGWRMILAGMVALAHAILPAIAVDRGGRIGTALRSLHGGRTTFERAVSGDDGQEQTLIVTLAVSFWAAVLPWIAGAEPAVAGALSVIALLFPVTLLFTSPIGRRYRHDRDR